MNKNLLKEEKIRNRKILIIQLSIIFFILLTWEVLTQLNIINPFLYSSPSRIIKTLFNIKNLHIHIFTTLFEILISFVLGFIISFILSIIFYIFPTIGKIFDPFLTVLNSLPKVALGPLIIIIFGANIKSIIIMAILINVIVSIITIHNGFIHTDKIKIKMFKTFEASKKDILFKLVIPSSFKTIISSLKLNISLTLIGVITGEFLSCKAGIGYLIIYGSQIFNLTLVGCGIFLLLIISFLLYKITTLFENKKRP